MAFADLAALKVRRGNVRYYNPGFMVVKPTPASLVVFKTISVFMKKWTDVHEQPRLLRVIQELKFKKIPINATFLNELQFTYGMRYYNGISSLLPKEDDPCISINKTNCPVIVLHNTCISTKEAKIYRFREHLMWLYDGKDKYYSSRTRKYITFTNQKPKHLLNQKQLTKRQISALKTALAIGYILNRVLILPKFYCSTRKGPRPCPLNSLISIKDFESAFSGRYRESSFLRHPLVPDVVHLNNKYQQLVSYSINSTSTNNVALYTITSDNVSSNYQNLNESLINCGTLEGVTFIFSNYTIGSEFQKRTRKAFRVAVYNQWKYGEYL